MTLTRFAILASSALALGAIVPLQAAQAQHACNLNNGPPPDGTLFPGQLYCGDISSYSQKPN